MLEAPTRADLGKLDLTKNQGTLLTNSPEVITLVPGRALMRWEQQSRGRRAGTFVVVPERSRPFESDYEVVDARVEGASVREVPRLAAETGLVGDQTGELSSVADALAEIYELFYEETRSEDGLRFRAWLKDRKGTAAFRVAHFFEMLQATLRQIEILGLTRHELEVSKSQIYGSILRPRLDADADFLRIVVEGTLENESMKPTVIPAAVNDPERPRS